MACSDTNTRMLYEISPKLTEDCLQEFLQVSSGHNDMKLVHYDVEKGGTTKGDSYLSTVTRIKVKGVSKVYNKTHSLALIVKGLPANIGRRKTFKLVEFFHNEAAFYNEVVPRFTSFQEKRKPSKPFMEIPRCYKAVADGENDFIIMEDLSESGYKATSRQEGLDFEHCTKVLQILGRFHALSLAMKDQDPEEFKKAANSIQNPYYSPDSKTWYEGLIRKTSDVALDAVSRELPGSIYEEKLKNLTDSGFYNRMVDLVKPKEPNAVIGHGDTWCPNFLFMYSKCDDIHKCEVKSAKVIDFQLARYGSPALDLSLMIYSCTTKKVRDSHYDDLLQTYYRSLCEFLVDLGSSPDAVFPYKSFQSEIAAYFIYGFAVSLESVPLTIMDDSDAPDLDQIEGDEAVPIADIMIFNPIKTKHGRLRITDNLRHAVDNGYL